MLSNMFDVKRTAQGGAWVWRRVALPLLLALLAIGFVGLGTGLASSAAPLGPATVSSQQAYSAPAMMVWNGTVYVGWTGRNAAHNLNLMTYDPAQPSDLKEVVTVASTSLLPVALAPAGVASPYVVVAWRTATDAHVRTAVYEGGPFLHNPVYTTETTPYGPALYSPYMSWAGTDAARSVNVSFATIF